MDRDDAAECGTLVYVRVRADEPRRRRALEVVADSGKIVLKTGANDERTFTFDLVGDEATAQPAVFEQVGLPLAESCLRGYNATVFAYGQTGAGKTFTMVGPVAPDGSTLDAGTRGLTPRVLDHLFAAMAREERASDGALEFRACGSFLQIYNENITDLLDEPPPSGAPPVFQPSGSSLSLGAAVLKLREDASRGIYVEGLTHAPLADAAAAEALFKRGTAQRAVGSTGMNSESSRSHSVFTLKIEATEKVAGPRPHPDYRFSLSF